MDNLSECFCNIPVFWWKHFGGPP